MANVVLLEDEAGLREEVAAFLEKRGWHVAQAGSITEFRPLMAGAKIAVIDVTLPDGNGFDAAAELRRKDAGCGIIMLTACSTTQDKLKGLYGGADHYLVKPVKLLELAAIMDALRRRVVSGWRYVRQERRLCSPDGAGLTLSSHETVLFELLAQRSGQPVSRRLIVEAFDQDWLDYDQRRLDTLVSRLRRRWKSVVGTDLPLKTEHREGYSFVAPISLV